MSAADLIRARIGPAPIDCAIVLGTGLGPLADAVDEAIALAYAELPGFPRAGVSGHAGRLVVGRLEGRRVAMMQGRAHVYETGDARVMQPAIAALAGLGARALLLTNAAGSLREDMPPGSVMAIADHIGLFGPNPLIGATGDERFVSMNDAYDPALRAALGRGAAAAGVTLRSGIYAWVTGPSFETPAEIRALQRLGADAVGMSTVPEVILARHAGLRVAALSMITNFGAGMAAEAPSHTETKTVALACAQALGAVVRGFLREIAA
ncbi:purine-nucleoside phosphorylase [Phreatobacter sp. AB_2022a]|uniref:purine-nucleoside phosphorylase n=1 Tax=Phreatobacter sp. AB_2022a TaxID=3003134 RepID=UPI0022871F5F|nr:purine-nucleoside phosphorylase [Phreatobacter sp. AB_2022a]MCZ0737169.1 purine-nucleoside phosphorylase [Phreatobacter sp. AB_2022a]